jgi:hypothetical protein
MGEPTSKTELVVGNHKNTNRERKLFELISTHPYFEKKVEEIRKKCKIPSGGFLDQEKAFMWEHNNNFNHDNLVTESSKLSFAFRIKPVYVSKIKDLVYNFILCPSRQIGEGKKVVAAVISATNRESNRWLFTPGFKYIEIMPHTSFSDLKKAWDKTAGYRTKQPFSVTEPEDVSRFIWQLRRKKLKNKEIAAQVNDRFGTKLKFNNVDVYLRRYRGYLEKLRPLRLK